MWLFATSVITIRRDNFTSAWALLWTATAARILTVLYSFVALCSSRAQWLWSLVMCALLAIGGAPFYVGAFVCGRETGIDDDQLFGCATAGDRYVPWFPNALALLAPWLFLHVFVLSWHLAGVAALVECVTVAVVILVSMKNTVFSIPVSIIIMANWLVGMVSAYTVERNDRRLYRMHLHMLKQIELIKNQVRQRHKAEAQARKLTDFMNASLQMMFELSVTYLTPPTDIDIPDVWLGQVFGASYGAAAGGSLVSGSTMGMPATVATVATAGGAAAAAAAAQTSSTFGAPAPTASATLAVTVPVSGGVSSHAALATPSPVPPLSTTGTDAASRAAALDTQTVGRSTPAAE
ncbi:hypothetical protein EON62_06300, partial [archaeon]